MRTAQDIINDYRKRGYSDERLRALANGRAEPMRSEMLALLGDTQEESIEEILEAVTHETVDNLPDSEPEIELVDGEDEAIEMELPEPAAADLPEEADSDSEEAAVEEDQPVAEAAEEDDVAPVTEAMVLSAYEPDPEEESADLAEDGADILAETLHEVEAEAEIEHEPKLEITDEPGAEIVNEHEAETEEPLVENTQDEAAEELEVPVAETVTGEEAEVAVAPVVDAAKPLTPIQVERLTPEEYAEAYPQSNGVGDVVGLAELESLQILGEAWPSVASVEAASHTPVLTHQEESALIAFHGDDEQMDLFDELRQSKAARRSLLQIKEAMDEDPEFHSAWKESSVLHIDPPYAITEENEVGPHLLEDDEEEILMGSEESGLIRFPSEMMPMYDAIDAARPSDAEAFAAALVKEAARDIAGEANMILPVAASAVTVPTVDAVEDEIIRMRAWLSELEEELRLKDIEANQLKSLIDDRDTVLEVQVSEIDNLRAELETQKDALTESTEQVSLLQAAERELKVTRHRLADTERERNILSSETVPNLQKDKEDMAEVLERQTIDFQRYRSDAGRRQALAYTLAAAASLLMVVVPLLHMMRGNNIEAGFEMREAELVARLDQATRRAEHAESTALAATNRISDLENEYSLAKATWQGERSRLRARSIDLQTQLAVVRQSNDVRTLAPSPDNVRAANNRVGLQTEPRATVTVGAHRNEVTGVESWLERRRQARAGNTGEAATVGNTVNATVQAGEGISDVLRRVTGSTGDMTVWEEVGRLNNLRRHSRGYWIIHPGQQIKLPRKPGSVASAQ